MSLLKKIKNHSLEAIVGVGILAGVAYAPRNDSGYVQNYVFADDSVASIKTTSETAHYLKNIDCPKDPVIKLFEKWRVYNSLQTKYPTHNDGSNLLNGSIVLEKEILGTKVKMTFMGYVKKGNKVVNYAADGTEVLSEKEFEAVVNDQVNYLAAAAVLAKAKFDVVYPKILACVEAKLRKEKQLGDKESLKDLLDKEIPEYDGLKVRDTLFIPENNSTADFMPTNYFFGSFKYALGATYLGTGVVAIDYKGRILDYINGAPSTLMHEMIHNNPKLEGFPLAMHFDAELWADFPMLTDTDYLDFSLHSYLKDVRKLAKILFNFDSDTVFKDVREYSLMFGAKLEDEDNYKKLRGVMQKVNKISEVIQSTALNEVVPEFYTNPLYWITVNQFLHDDAAAFKINFYRKFEPTCLGGPEETRKFMDSNKEIVREASESVLKEIKSESGKKKIVFLDDSFDGGLKEYFKSLSQSARTDVLSAAEQLGLSSHDNPDAFFEFVSRLYKTGVLDKSRIEQLKRKFKK